MNLWNRWTMNKCQPDDAIRKDLWLYTCYSTLIQKGPDAVLPEIRSHLAMLLVMLDSREDMAKVKKIYNEVQNLRADNKLIDERVSKEFKRLAREIGGLEKVIDVMQKRCDAYDRQELSDMKLNKKYINW